MKLPSGKDLERLLESVEQRRKIVETSLQSVVQGYTTALFVYGPAGLGKTHVLTTILDGLCEGSWLHHTAYSTPKALMLAFAETPSRVHLFEDCEKMLKTDLAASILRAACGATGDRERWITYETAHEKFRIRFTGGVIVATNQNLAKNNGPLQGVASRFRPLKWDLTLEERLAVIASIASRPWSKGKASLTAKECTSVAHQLAEIADSCVSTFDLDLRIFSEHALPAYAHAKATGSGNWKDVLLAKLSGIARTEDERQDQRTERLASLATMIAAGQGTAKQKVEEWKAKTGLGQAIYYRHLKTGKKRAK